MPSDVGVAPLGGKPSRLPRNGTAKLGYPQPVMTYIEKNIKELYTPENSRLDTQNDGPWKRWHRLKIWPFLVSIRQISGGGSLL